MKALTRKGLMALALAGVALAAIPQTAEAANRTNILVMAEDGDRDSLRRDHRISKRIQRAAIESQLNQAGYDVYDETALTYQTGAQGRVRRDLSELVDIARNQVRNPGNPMHPVTIRSAVTYEVFASPRNIGNYSKEVRVRISGRIIDVPSGRVQGAFEVASPSGMIRVKPDCNRECQVEAVGDYAAELGSALGAELATLLHHDPASAAGRGSVSAPAPYTPPVYHDPAEEVIDIHPLNETRYLTARSNLREGPDTDYRVLTTWGAGHAVHVTGKVADRHWYRINIDGTTAYVHGSLIR